MGRTLEPLATTSTDGGLVLGSVDMLTSAWNVTTLRDLWTASAFRGVSVVVPYVDGGVLRRRRLTLSTYVLRLGIIGGYDHFGNRLGDEKQGLEDNVAYLEENVANGLLITGSLTMPSGEVRTANLVAGPLRLGQGLDDVQLATMQIEVDGKFTAGS